MNQDKLKPIGEFMDSLPDPKWWQFMARLNLWRWERKQARKKKKTEPTEKQ